MRTVTGLALGSGSFSIRRAVRAVLALIFLFAAAAPAVAGEFANARLVGFGGARRALGSSTEAVYANPAGLAFARRYDIETSYVDDFRDTERVFNLTVADGQAGPIAGALALGYHRFRPAESESSALRLEGIRADISAAVPLVERFSLGFGARYMNLRALDGDDEIPGGGASDIGFDAGIQWRPSESIALGASVENFNAADQPGLPRAYGAGIGFASGGLELEADIAHAWESSDPVYTASAGYLAGGNIPLRFAIAYLQDIDRIRLSGGIGIAYQPIEVDLGYAQTLGVSAEADGRVLVATLRLRAF